MTEVCGGRIIDGAWVRCGPLRYWNQEEEKEEEQEEEEERFNWGN